MAFVLFINSLLIGVTECHNGASFIPLSYYLFAKSVEPLHTDALCTTAVNGSYRDRHTHNTPNVVHIVRRTPYHDLYYVKNEINSIKD